MEVHVISSEIIKPSFQTPHNLRHYKLSFIDQKTPRVYNPFIYYYELNDDRNDQSNKIASISLNLKKSLSETLTLYYPLAGRYVGNNFVDCNDVGVPFLTARVAERTLSEILKNPVMNELDKLIPFEQDEIRESLVGVQLNIFACGSIALGVCVSHGVADALSSLVFIKNWMAIARGEHVPPPEFAAANFFPAKDLRGFNRSSYIEKKDTIQTKLFSFEASKIETLKEKYSLDGKRPSRVAALSTFIWSRFHAATKTAVESEAELKPLVISHAVNIRPKFDPPLTEHSFGNLFDSSTTVPSSARGEPALARQMGEDIRNVDKDTVERLRMVGDEIVDQITEGMERFVREEIDILVFTSLCRFPLYEADFGFGKPKWVSSASRCFKNLVGYMDSQTGDGIEAYVCLKPQEMAKFEADQELLAFVRD